MNDYDGIVNNDVEYRDYQRDAHDAILKELEINDKCLVKMFCGTGKSLIMQKVMVDLNREMNVFVFPSLSLVEQFFRVYITGLVESNGYCAIQICSKDDSTTDIGMIRDFLKTNVNKKKVVCITYQSSELLKEMGKIDLCVYDEAHHVVGSVYQKCIFGSLNIGDSFIVKQVFMTATPVNRNGILMFNRDNKDIIGDCGKLVYDYTYMNGVNDKILNRFGIRTDFFTKNTNMSVMESIIRSIIHTKNTRILTFHATVKKVDYGKSRSVDEFYERLDTDFIESFEQILEDEFPTYTGVFKNIRKSKVTYRSFSAETSHSDRIRYLKEFDETKDNEIYIICSCETIGEGIDTKNANMCVFVDPKTSHTRIIQNIGRIVRKLKNVDRNPSTVLLPVFIDKTKYVGCNGDPDKCDEVIRTEMNDKNNGDFTSILNVLSAIKQEDEDLYNLCLYYPNRYSPKEIVDIIRKNGLIFGKMIGNGGLIETLENVCGISRDKVDLGYLDDIDDLDNIDGNIPNNTEKINEIIQKFSDKSKQCIKVLSDLISDTDEGNITTFNDKYIKRGLIQLGHLNTKGRDIDVDDLIGKNINDVVGMIGDGKTSKIGQADIFIPLVNSNKKKPGVLKSGKGRKREITIHHHQDSDIRVLWNTKDIDISNKITNHILDCKVKDIWMDNLQQCDDWISINKKRPSSTSKDQIESKLGGWIVSQVANYKNSKHSMKLKSRRQKWDEFTLRHSCYFISDEDEWLSNLKQCDEWILMNKKKPVKNSKNLTEKKLGKWLDHQVQNYRKIDRGMKIQSRRKKWETFVQRHSEYFPGFVYIPYVDVKKDIKKNVKDDEIIKKDIDDDVIMTDVDNDTVMTDVNDDLTLKTVIELKNMCKHREISHSSRIKKSELIDLLNGCCKKHDVDQPHTTIKDKKDQDELCEQPTIPTIQTIPIIPTIPTIPSIQTIPTIQSIQTIPTIPVNTPDPIKPTITTITVIPSKQYKPSKSIRLTIPSKPIKPTKPSKPSKPSKSTTQVNTSDPIKPTTITVIPSKPYKPTILTTITTKSNDEQQQPKKTKKIIKSNKFQSGKSPHTSDIISDDDIEKQSSKNQHEIPELSILNQKYKSMNSSTLHSYFEKHPEKWDAYHDVSEKNEQSFLPSDIPRNRIIQHLSCLKSRNTKTVVDMGCGRVLIADHFKNDKRFNFINYDNVSTREDVIKQDIAYCPLEDNSVQIVILSLAMWCRNNKDYIRQAHRILETNGILYIAEATKRWTSITDPTLPEHYGDRLVSLLGKYFTISTEDIINNNDSKFLLYKCHSK
jgi:superfamily II DNA or RNA helicase